ncbi:hypothetical protein Drorol1_Dr00010289 [Drosera rotundifolia]
MAQPCRSYFSYVYVSVIWFFSFDAQKSTMYTQCFSFFIPFWGAQCYFNSLVSGPDPKVSISDDEKEQTRLFLSSESKGNKQRFDPCSFPHRFNIGALVLLGNTTRSRSCRSSKQKNKFRWATILCGRESHLGHSKSNPACIAMVPLKRDMQKSG